MDTNRDDLMVLGYDMSGIDNSFPLRFVTDVNVFLNFVEYTFLVVVLPLQNFKLLVLEVCFQFRSFIYLEHLM